MASEEIEIIEWSNGLTLLVEPMRHVQSAAFSILVPAGTLYEPEGQNGTSAALCDLLTRGAGTLDSRQFAGALDQSGVQRSESVGWNFLTFSGATIADRIYEVLPLYADLLRRPHLPAEQFPAVMSGVEQTLLAEEDEPQRKVFTELRRACYDSPWNRPSDGTLDELPSLTHDSVCAFYQQSVQPQGALIGVAGNVDLARLRQVIEACFADWKPGTPAVPGRKSTATSGRHISHASTQTQIGIAFPAVPYGHEDYYAAWAAVSILSGGSSSRLFTEVREKRGLCYSVYATLHSLLTEGRVLAYAGATTDRAQETLDVMVAEMRRLSQGIEPQELARCLARAKSSLIMQQESTGARAGALARDWFHLRRINTLHEIRAALERLTIEQILAYVEAFPARPLTVLTIGEESLRIPQD